MLRRQNPIQCHLQLQRNCEVIHVFVYVVGSEKIRLMAHNFIFQQSSLKNTGYIKRYVDFQLQMIVSFDWIGQFSSNKVHCIRP